MIRPTSLTQTTSPRPPCPDAPGAEADPVFDLTFLDNARENYFLPGIDRLAATLAAGFAGPARVRLEAEGQFLEYTLHPERVEGSLNGSPFALERQDAGNGAWRLAGETPGGNLNIKVSTKAQGSNANGLVNGMPFNQGIRPGAEGMQLGGNFACARLAGTVAAEDGGLHVTGTLGRHTLDYRVDAEGEGYLVSGQFGDMTFRQTIMPA